MNKLIFDIKDLNSQIKKQKLEIKFIDNLYKKLLIELSVIFNDIHEVKWKPKSWEILLGPWLSRYITVIVDRYRNINRSQKLNIIKGSWNGFNLLNKCFYFLNFLLL